MGISKTITGLTASVGALALMGAGIANAVIPDPDPSSSPSYTMCGTVYAQAGATTVADNHPAPNSGIPDTATVVSGATVGGTLKNSSGGTVATYTPIATNSAGQFCFTGSFSMVSTITGGGRVELNVGSLPSPYTTVVHITHNNVIDGTAFNNHRVGGVLGTRATGLNILVS